MVRNNVLVLAGDDHRDAGCVYHSGADRAEQHSGESAPAVAADHDELGGLGFVEEMARRAVKHQPTVNGDVGIAFLPASQAFREDFRCPGLQGRPFHAEHAEMSESLQACRATRSTPRKEASSKAIAVANSDAGEPSMPTNTGNCEGPSRIGASSWITATGQWA